MSETLLTRTPGPTGTSTRQRWMRVSSMVIAAGVVSASTYGLLAGDAYRGLDRATIVGARAQDVVSLGVAVALVVLGHPALQTARGHLVRLGLLAYVAYSFAIYLIGVPMNRMFLVYVLVVSVSVAALADGLVRMRTAGWGAPSHRLVCTTGWFLVVTAVVFTGLWLVALTPFALGGATPEPAGPGGTPYPVFVLDLTVVLPCVFAVGWLLLHHRPIAFPLAVVTLVKIASLFAALWVGVVVNLLVDGHVALGPDWAPSAVLLLASLALLVRWVAVVPHRGAPTRSHIWDQDS